MVRVGLLDTGLPLWSQDMTGRGLPSASQESRTESPGSFLIKLWRPRVFLVKTGAATASSRGSSGWTGSEMRYLFFIICANYHKVALNIYQIYVQKASVI